VSERAVFDIRVWVEADTRAEVYERITQLVERARLLEPPGVSVRYSQLRSGHALSAFRPTIERRRRRAA
jgi:hypothetical protein